MATQLTGSGIDLVGSVRRGTHFCHFYQSREDLHDVVISYLSAGLSHRELCQWVASGSLTLAHREVLPQRIPRSDEHLADGTLEIVLDSDVFLSDRSFAPHRAIEIWSSRLAQLKHRGVAVPALELRRFWSRGRLHGLLPSDLHAAGATKYPRNSPPLRGSVCGRKGAVYSNHRQPICEFFTSFLDVAEPQI